MSNKTIVFISCVKTKRNHPCKAEDMYISPLFRKSLTYAKSLNPDYIFILSAKYGAIPLDKVIEPYELTLLHMKERERRLWSRKVIQQLRSENITFTEKAVFLCGDKYRKYIARMFKDKVVPLKGVSFGKQLQWYNRQLGE